MQIKHLITFVDIFTRDQDFSHAKCGYCLFVVTPATVFIVITIVYYYILLLHFFVYSCVNVYGMAAAAAVVDVLVANAVRVACVVSPNSVAFGSYYVI